MTRELKITAVARAKVASREFADETVRLIKTYQADGCSQAVGVALLATRIAAELAGLESPPSKEEEKSTFLKFVDDHVAEINSVADKLLESAMLRDAENQPMN